MNSCPHGVSASSTETSFSRMQYVLYQFPHSGKSIDFQTRKYSAFMLVIKQYIVFSWALLLVQCRNLDVSQFGWTPLMWAVTHGRVDVTDALLHRGANANDRDKVSS